MSQNEIEEDEFAKLLAESTGSEADEIEAAAEDLGIQSPEEADWEYVE